MRRPSSGAGAIFGVYDCTGHGVPGAFMTLLAERALDAGVEVTSKEGETKDRAGRILTYVDEFIRAEVNANDGTSSNDGMDAFLLDYRPGGAVFMLLQILKYSRKLTVNSLSLKVMSRVLDIAWSLVNAGQNLGRVR